MSVDYVIGDATAPVGPGRKIIVHVCNDIGGWGRGFVVALSKRWKAPEVAFREAFQKEPPPQLGEVLFVPVDQGLWVANMIAQRDVVPIEGVPPIRYEALRQCLREVRDFARKERATVHGPRFGAGLAGGDWATVEGIIQSELADVPVTIYDLR